MATDLLLIGLLILLNAAFAGTELALVSLREGQLHSLEQRGGTGRRLAQLARDPNKFLATIQVGITLAGFLASAAAAVSLAEPLVEPLDFLGRAAEPVAIVIVTALLSFVTLVLGELAPKRIALQRAERWGLLAVRPLGFMAALARPVVWLLARSTDLVVRALGGDPEVGREHVTEDELRDMVAAQTRFSSQQRRIIAGAIDIAQRTLREVLVPRRDVVTLEADTQANEAVEVLKASGHSRAPVVSGELDDVSRVVHLMDLVGAEGTAGELGRQALALPESLGVLDALRRLQAERQSMAIVINEYGGAEGVVTIEDILEELVGEIYDESDPDVRAVHWEPDGSLVLVGTFPMHDLSDLGVELPEGNYETVAGLVLDCLGHIPEEGEVAHIGEWRVDVVSVDGRAITEVRLAPESGKQPAETDERSTTSGG